MMSREPNRLFWTQVGWFTMVVAALLALRALLDL
jgi:hypothetical protein